MAPDESFSFLPKLKPLLAALLEKFKAGDYITRRESAIALSKFKGERATDFLLETFESDNIQDFLALALGNLDNQKAISLLIHALNDSQYEVRFNAARALGMIQNNEAFNVLMEALNEYADNIISGGGAKEKQSRLFFEEETIISAITSLGKLKNHLSTALLKRILAQEKSPRIRSAVIIALGLMASERMLPIFQAALRDEDSRVRANAIEAIESIKSSSVVGILQPYLEDCSNRVRANVAKAIWRYGDFDVSETMSEMLESQDKWQRASAAYALGEIRTLTLDAMPFML
ncbi:HEAT repeat domain-containing protein [bacterium]|nr:HEAT repeat domain-containing protein [bacterium]